MLPGDDLCFLDFHYRLLAWESVTQGEIPYWNPYNSGGHNLLGQPFHLLLYPLYDLVYLFGKEQLIYVLGVVNVIHLCMASLGMYFLLRNLLDDRMIAFWGGVAYVGAHPVITGFLVGQLLATYVYLPWIFLWIQGFSERSFRKNVLGMTVLIYLAVAGGFMQWNFFFLLTVLAGLLLRANPLRKEGARSILSGLAIFFVGGTLAFSLGAIEFVPEVEQNVHGSRGNLAGETVDRNLQNWTTPYPLSLKIFFPNMFIKNFRAFVPNPTIFESDNFLAYAGIATGLLAIIGLLIGPRKLNSWKILYLFLFSVALGLPAVTGFLNFLTMGADLVQSRIGGFLAFAGVVLAAGTLSEILEIRAG